MSKYNMYSLIPILYTLKELHIDAWMLTFPFLNGYVLENYDKIVPENFKELKLVLEDVFARVVETDIILVTNGIPFCYFKKYRDYNFSSFCKLLRMGFDWNNRKVLDEKSISQKEKYMLDMIELYKPRKCNRCMHNYVCSGFWKQLIGTEDWPHIEVIEKPN